MAIDTPMLARASATVMALDRELAEEAGGESVRPERISDPRDLPPDALSVLFLAGVRLEQVRRYLSYRPVTWDAERATQASQTLMALSGFAQAWAPDDVA